MSGIHKNIPVGAEAAHPPGYVQDTDPGAVGALKPWVDTSGGAGAWVFKVRNAANTGWETLGAAVAVAVEDEGTTVLVSAARLNFAGAGVTVTDAGGGEVLVTIPGATSPSYGSSPSAYGDLDLWVKFDAAATNVYSDAGVTPAGDGGVVQQATDLSGDGRTISQATSAKRPIRFANAALPPRFNGLDFEPDDALDTNLSIGNPCTIIACLTPKEGSGSSYTRYIAGSNNAFFGLAGQSYQAYTGGDIASALRNADYGDPVVLAITSSGSEVIFYVNGQRVGRQTGYNNTFATLYFGSGAWGSSGRFMLHEAAVYSGVRTPREIMALAARMLAEWTA